MRCKQARLLFQSYLDNAVTSAEMQALQEHLSACPACRSGYRKLANTRALVASLGRNPAPGDLALKIRLALSRERSRTWRNVLQSYIVHIEDSFNSFMFPATAGILTAIIFFAAVAGFFVAPAGASGELVPSIYLPARLQPPQTAMSSVADIDLVLDAPVTIRVFIDAGGRVQNYEIVSGPDDEAVRAQLNRALLFANFSPAYAFGQPVAGTAIICFSHVSVKG